MQIGKINILPPILPSSSLRTVTRNTRLKGWDVLRVLQDKKGNVTMPRSFTKTNPLRQPVVKTNKIK